MTLRRRRTGFTLLEVVLVAIILVIAASLVYPSLRGMYGYYKLQGAVDSVRAAWATARARAVEEGRPYRFAVESQGNHYRVAPDQPSYWSGGGSSSDPGGQGMVLEKALPAGVRFAVNGDPSTPPPEEASGKDDPAVPASGDWTPAATFLPNGTAQQDVKILFQVKGARPILLHLRGLTGTVSTSTP